MVRFSVAKSSAGREIPTLLSSHAFTISDVSLAPF